MAHPKASDWKQYDEVLNAGTRGFNALQVIPRIMQKEIPWLNDFNMGFCVAEDLPEWMTMGWQHLETSHLGDTDEWNRAIALRFNISDAGGHVKYRDNYLMIMPKDYREKLKRIRNEAAERDFENAVEQTASYAHPQDERYAEMKEASAELSEVSGYRVQAEGAAESGAKPKRGRPPGSKNKKK